jgi:uncharacterized protein
MACRRTCMYTLLLLAALVAVSGIAKDVPFLSGRVNDQAGIIPDSTRTQIEEKLKAYETESGAQVVVLTVDSLDGDPIEDFSHKVASTWQLGQKDKNNGILFLVAKGDRKMRIEVGYGLEAQLTDAQSGRILDNVVRPRFRDGDFGGGVSDGVDSILGTLRGTPGAIPLEAPSSTSAATKLSDVPWTFRLLMGGMFFVVVGMFTLLATFGKGCSGWFLYLFLIPFYLAFPMVFLGKVGGLSLFAIYLVGLPILKLLFHQTQWGKSYLTRHAGLVALAASSGSSSHGWSSGSGWGGGGFSGGGGSFGGGGASSGW